MSISEITNMLSCYCRYRQGSGKKYAEPNAPYPNEVITDAIKRAVMILRVDERFINSITEKCL